MAKKKRPMVVFETSGPIPEFIINSKAVSINIAGSSFFAAIVPTPTIVDSDIDKLDAAEALVRTRTTGLAGDRDIKYNAVKVDMDDWKGAVQSIADHTLDYTTAVAIIHAAGFGVKVNGVHVKAPFAVTNKKGAAGVGSLKMKAVKAVKGRTTYEFAISTDKGLTWIPYFSSPVANMEATGLVSGTSVLFRGRAIADRLASAWLVVGLVVE